MYVGMYKARVQVAVESGARVHISLTAGKSGLTSVTVKTRFLSDENVAKKNVRQHNAL